MAKKPFFSSRKTLQTEKTKFDHMEFDMAIYLHAPSQTVRKSTGTPYLNGNFKFFVSELVGSKCNDKDLSRGVVGGEIVASHSYWLWQVQSIFFIDGARVFTEQLGNMLDNNSFIPGRMTQCVRWE